MNIFTNNKLETNKINESETKEEKVFRKLNEFLINISSGEFTVKKQNDNIVFIDKRETEKM